MDAIEAKNVTKIYLKGKNPINALRGVSFRVRRGEIYGFLGPNGAGKSTMIKIITTILQPTSGKVEVLGLDVIDNKIEVSRNIGYVPENPGFYEDMTVLENIKFYSKFYNIYRDDLRKRIVETLQRVGLPSAVWKRKIKALSHGMRKRLALAQALIHDPEILVLDEPSGGLDPVGIYEFRKIIKTLKENGKTIFLSSHILGEVEKLCDRICIISSGKIILEDTIENLLIKRATTTFEITLKKIENIPSSLNIISYDVNRNMITIKASSDSISDIISELIKNGNKVYSVRPLQPSLEEIFIESLEVNKYDKRGN